MKKVSILLAAYNGSRYIEEQIISIQKQTFRDFELIICDDCSSDNTVDIIEKYARNDSRIKIYRNEKNLGFKKNFERLLNLATCDYIALSDQDDVWTENHIEKLLFNIGDKALVCGNAYLADVNANPTGVTLLDCSHFDFLPKTQDEWFFFLLHGSIFQGAACLFRKTLLPYIKTIPEKVRFHDYWIAMQAALHGGVTYFIDPILYYRQHGSNITTNKRGTFFELVKRAFFTDSTMQKNKEQIDILFALVYYLEEDSRKKLVADALQYFMHLNSFLKMPALFYFCRNYKQIYLSNDKKLFFMRIMKKFVFGR